MKTSRRPVLALALSLAAMTLLMSPEAAVAAPAKKAKVTLWASGSANVRDLFEALIREYEAQPDHAGKTDVELQFIMSGSGQQSLADRLAAAKLAGKANTDFDIIAENADAILSYMQKGGDDLFVKVNFSRIPNYRDVLLKSVVASDYVVPYRGTTVVLVYDSARVPNPPKTLEDLYAWIKAHPGRFAYNVPGSGGAGSAFARAVIYSYMPEEAKISSDPKWKEQWSKGFDKLGELHPYMYKSGGKVVYPNKNQGTLDLLINKEVDIIPAWADQALQNISQGILPATAKIYQITPALSGTAVVFGLPSIGHNPEAAYDFINFVISPKGQKLCLETIYAVPVIDFSKIKSAQIDAIKGLNIGGFKVSSMGKLGDEFNKTWDTTIGVLN
jgi:putative spermidine/putrescine transport system substrate-binding protein